MQTTYLLTKRSSAWSNFVDVTNDVAARLQA